MRFSWKPSRPIVAASFLFLAIFVWRPPGMPDPKSLVCTSCFSWKGTELPEFDRFGVFSYQEALSRVGKAMAERLAAISLDSLTGASS